MSRARHTPRCEKSAFRVLSSFHRWRAGRDRGPGRAVARRPWRQNSFSHRSFDANGVLGLGRCPALGDPGSAVWLCTA
eukprot:1688586-Prymnesium_polylepis.2